MKFEVTAYANELAGQRIIEADNLDEAQAAFGQLIAQYTFLDLDFYGLHRVVLRSKKIDGFIIREVL